MQVIGKTGDTIRVIFEGEEAVSFVPDDMGNRDRIRIWQEWEMGPPDPETGERERLNTIPDYDPPPPVAPPPTPSIFAAAAVCITDGAVSAVELAAQLQSAYYEDGWLVVGFSEPQVASGYLIFAQADVPAKIEQFKSEGYFELILTDPGTGDPVEPGRVDLSIVKVR